MLEHRLTYLFEAKYSVASINASSGVSSDWAKAIDGDYTTFFQSGACLPDEWKTRSDVNIGNLTHLSRARAVSSWPLFVSFSGLFTFFSPPLCVQCIRCVLPRINAQAPVWPTLPGQRMAAWVPQPWYPPLWLWGCHSPPPPCGGSGSIYPPSAVGVYRSMPQQQQTTMSWFPQLPQQGPGWASAHPTAPREEASSCRSNSAAEAPSELRSWRFLWSPASRRSPWPSHRNRRLAGCEANSGPMRDQ